MPTAAIIGGGPSGLMAAEMLLKQGLSVDLYEAKPSVGRKFLMAGKSGLNYRAPLSIATGNSGRLRFWDRRMTQFGKRVTTAWRLAS